jgi:hypothetical protein
VVCPSAGGISRISANEERRVHSDRFPRRYGTKAIGREADEVEG